MNLKFVSMVALTVFALALGTQPSVETTVGQDKAAEKEKTTSTKAAKKPSGRLPSHYGKVGLSDEQRTNIYGIQSNYRTQIASLQKQIDSLKEKEGAEIFAVLTPDQQKKLSEFLEAAKKAAEARRNKKKSS